MKINSKQKRPFFLYFLLNFAFISLCSTGRVSAQYYYYNDRFYDAPVLFELGGSVGAMNSLTDLGGNKGPGKKFVKDLNFGSTELVSGLYFGAMYHEIIGLRLEANFGKVSAYDSILSAVAPTNLARMRYNRNLSFSSNITEISLMAEFHPFQLLKNRDNNDNSSDFSPYVLAGIGYFTFNPQANLNGRMVDLQPLRTEGQGFAQYPDRKPYNLHSISFPFGAGVKYDISPLVNLRTEVVYRITQTDYLDDVSTTYIDKSLFQANGFTGTKLSNALLLTDRQLGEFPRSSRPGRNRGNASNKDSFFSFNFKLGISIGRQSVK